MIGNDVVEIVKRTNSGQYDEFAPIPAPDTYISVTGCSFQVIDTTEIVGLTTIVTASAKVYMPVTVDTTAITSRDGIRYRGRTYEVRGPAVTTTDLRGADNHVWCLAEWQAG